jgi:hypothetical protein
MMADDPIQEHLCELLCSVTVAKWYYLNKLSKPVNYDED